MRYYINLFIFVIISCTKPITDTRNGQFFINDCMSQGDSSKLKEFCECCYIEAQKINPKFYTNSHIKMLENQEINYKDAIEENCINLLY